MNVLVTGGAGYIGSITCVELSAAGHTPVIVDSFVNSQPFILKNIEKLIGKKPAFAQIDVRNTAALTDFMKTQKIDAVIHFAALKAVGKSVKQPLLYYDNNLGGLLSVLQAMENAGIAQIVFSSSATVYGDPDTVPIRETDTLKETTNPYGATKQFAERILQDTASQGTFNTVLLRYFNPIGAHPSGLLGELPLGVPNNLVPFVAQAAAGLRDKLTVFGDDYVTPDGSGVRDYIHVVDLAKAHVSALSHLQSSSDNVTTLNIGTGKGTSVLEIINTFEKVNKVTVPYKIGPRREGDIATCYANVDKAAEVLGWQAELSLEEALKDTWNWQKSLK